MSDNQPNSNILNALTGQPVESNEPKSRILEAIENGGGGGGGTPADYNQVKQQVQKNKNDIAELNSRISTVENNLTTLLNSLNNVESDLTALETSQNQQDTAIAGLQGVTAENAALIATNSGAISAIQAEQVTQNNRLTALENGGGGGSVQYTPLNANQGVKLKGVKALDTGLTMDGSITITAKTALFEVGQGVIVGAYSSTTARTVAKFLGSSGKIQSQWAANKEITELNGLDMLQPFEFTQDKDGFTATQGGVTLTTENSGYSGSDTNVPIYLFNQTETGEFNRCILFSATVGGVTFTPARKTENGTDLGLVILKNGVELPLNGGTLEIVEFQAA